MPRSIALQLLGASLAVLASLFDPRLVGAAEAAYPDEVLARAAALRDLAMEGDLAYEIVESLTTEVGPRLAGTGAEARARGWAVDTLKGLGFQNVAIEPFEVPLWLRGVERASIVAPYPQPLTVTALGGSVSTGRNGVEGEIALFADLAGLQASAPGSLSGRIAFVDEPMTRTQDGSGYSVAVKKRREAAYAAREAGALAVLIRSVGTSSHRFAHTGQMRRLTDVIAPSVPAAALSAPDADQLVRALERAAVTVRLVLTPELRPPAGSGNVVAEIPGSSHPDDIVLLGAHLDSWDLGTGAVDDGAGVGIVVAAAKLLLDELEVAPARTIRLVLFGSEEVGLVGARAYNERHADSLARHMIAAESDFGAGHVWRFDTRVGEDALPAMTAISEVLRPLGIGPGNNQANGGPDLKFLRESGVPVASLTQNGWDYFDLHHTANDTLDKIDPATLRQNVAAYVVFAYLAAQSTTDFR